MNFIEQVKTMFTNKDDVSSFKSSHIFHNFVYMNDDILKYDCQGSIIWMLEFPHESLIEFIQMAENLPSYKSYIFEKDVIILAPLTVDIIDKVLCDTRYINNPFVNGLKEDVVINIPKDIYFNSTLDYTNGRPSLFGKVDDDFNDIEDSKKNYVDGMICQTCLVHAYDDIEQVKSDIIEADNRMALYLMDNDMYDLCKICYSYYIESKRTTLTLSYRQLYYKLSFGDTGYIDDLKYLIEDHIDITNLDDKLKAVIFDDISVPDTDVEQKISSELIDYNIPDTSNTADKFKV